MAKNFETGFIIRGDGRGGVRAIRANRDELERFDRQSRQTTGTTERMAQGWARARGAAGALAGAVGLSTAGFAAMIARQAEAARENQALSRSLGISVERLQEWQYAGMTVGVEADKIGDIFKDVSDKLGDFVATGGGEAADLFEQLNLDSEKLIQMSPDQQLLAIGEALSDVESRGERIFFLESIADDASRLMPLLENNATGLRAAAQEARDFGYALNDDQNRALAEAANSLTRVTGFAEGFANRLTVAVSPAISEAAGNLDELNAIVTDPAFTSALNDLAQLGAQMAQGLAEGSLTLVREIGTLDDRFRVMMNDSFGMGDGLQVGVSRVNAIRNEVDWLENLANGNWFDRITAGYNSVDQVNARLAEKQSQLASANDELFVSFNGLVQGLLPATQASRDSADAREEEAAAGDSLRNTLRPLLQAYDQEHAQRQKLIADRRQLRQELAEHPEQAEAIRRSIAAIDDQLGKLNGTQRQTQTEAERAAERLENAYTSTRDGIARQIALMGDATEASRLRYETEHGALANLDAARRRSLVEQARELDLMRERQGLLDEYVNRASLGGLFDQRRMAQQMGGVRGEIATGNLNGAIDEQARQGMPDVKGLDAQFAGPFGEANRIESEREQLQQWYAERIAMYEQFKQLEADKAAEYNQVIVALEQQRAQQMQSIDQQMQQARLQGYSSLFGDLSDMARGFAGEQSAIYQSMFAAEKAYSIASTLMSSYDAIAKAWASAPFPANLPAVATATVQTGALTAAVQGVTLTGQAHDGIDNTRAGTWLLEDNERVVDRRTNADLKQYLERENGPRGTRSSGGDSALPGSAGLTVHVDARGATDPAAMERAAQRGAEMGYRRVLEDFGRNGPARRSLNR